MTSLVAVLGIGKGTWIEVMKLISSEEWQSIFLITNEFGKEKFKPKKEVELIVIDERQQINTSIEVIKKSLEKKIRDTDVALNIASGSGKEHMAVISAILKLGLGIRLVSVDDSGRMIEV